MDRREKLIGGVNLSSSVVAEIGALCRPLLTKAEADIRYIDYADADSLRQHYANDPNVDIASIVETDALWGKNTLLEALGQPVDLILASHVIEHVPDLVTWLRELAAALTPRGQVRLAIPDRRFTFDFLRRHTELSDVLAAYLTSPRVPQPHALLDYYLNATQVDHLAAWRGEVDENTLQRSDTFDAAMSKARDVLTSGSYHDAHCWVFTPKSFALLMSQLCARGLVPFACDGFYDTEQDTIEFFVALRPSDDLAEIGRSWQQMMQTARDEIPNRVAQLKALTEELEARLKATEDQLQESWAQVQLAQHQIADSGRIAAAALMRVSALERSTSWRMTAPLRAASSVVKGFAVKKAIEEEKPAPALTVDPESTGEFQIQISRSGVTWTISPSQFESFAFNDGDRLAVIPEDNAQSLPTTWGDVSVPISPGRSVRVPAVYRISDFKGYRIPSHLISLTGAGPETLDSIGKAHIEQYKAQVGLASDMTILDLGCGIGRVAFQLLDLLGERGRYIGVDVTRDSIVWCQQNITSRHPNFTFHHADAVNELYNPFGSIGSADFRLPAADGSVDRIVLASVFTHLLEDEVLHYMREFSRVLKPDGLVYASFFLYSAEAVAAAETHGNTAWKATFSCEFGNGVYGNDPAYPRGAVAYTDEAMRRLMQAAGLQLTRPYLKGWWSGLYGEAAEDGQDAAIMMRAN